MGQRRCHTRTLLLAWVKREQGEPLGAVDDPDRQLPDRLPADYVPTAGTCPATT